MATNKQLASYHAKRLKRITKELRELGAQWEDVNFWVSKRFDDEADNITRLKTQLTESFRK